MTKGEDFGMKSYLVHVYHNIKSNDLIFNPNTENNDGLKTSLMKSMVIHYPYNATQIGESVIEAFIVSEDAQKEKLTVGKFFEDLGCKTYSSFVKTHHQVSLWKYPESGEYHLTPKEKYGTRGYVSIDGYPPKIFRTSASKEELGNAMLEAFKACK